jgi:hypothetical protein
MSPPIGKRERVFYAAALWVSAVGIGNYLGASIGEGVTMAVVALAGAVVGGDTYRPSGATKAAHVAEGA